jgi:hypothetical protein
MENIPNGKRFKVWTSINAFNDDGEWTELFVEGELIDSMPAPVKSIIARYTAFIPDFLLEQGYGDDIADALGGFSTLEEARNALLKGWRYEELKLNDDITYLTFEKRGDSLFFQHAGMYGPSSSNEFTVGRRGKITFVK